MADVGDGGGKKKKRILIGCTGSVAALKIPELIQRLMDLDPQVEVKLITTEPALHFFDSGSLPIHVHRDHEEWEIWQKRTDPVCHIELRRWADLMVIAPLSANTLAKLANGICDNLLTLVARAWDLKRPLLFAPAMNTYMWEHPLTASHIETLKGFGYIEIPCIEKTLVCGDSGFGAMAEVSTIVERIEETLRNLDSSS